MYTLGSAMVGSGSGVVASAAPVASGSQSSILISGQAPMVAGNSSASQISEELAGQQQTTQDVSSGQSIDDYQINQPSVYQRLSVFVDRIVDIDIAGIMTNMMFLVPNAQELNYINRFWNTNQNLIPQIVSDLFYANASYMKIDDVVTGSSEGGSFYSFKTGLAQQIFNMITNNDGFKYLIARMFNAKVNENPYIPAAQRAAIASAYVGSYQLTVSEQLLSTIKSIINNTELQECAFQIDRDKTIQSDAEQSESDLQQELARQQAARDAAYQEGLARARELAEQQARDQAYQDELNKHESTPVGDDFNDATLPIPQKNNTMIYMIGGAALVALLLFKK
jgi:hypothetical protein